MLVRDQLRELLGEEVEEEELQAVQKMSVSRRIRELKVAVADALYDNKAAFLLDNMQAANAALKRAKELKRQYQHFLAEWKRLEGEDAPVPRPEEGDDAESG